MYLCACLWGLGSCRGHLVGVDNCCDVGCILGKWQFGSHEVCKRLLIWEVIMYYVCVCTCNDLCEVLAEQGTCHAPRCRFEICILLFCLACFFCRSESRSEWVACKMELLQVRVALVPINCEQYVHTHARAHTHTSTRTHIYTHAHVHTNLHSVAWLHSATECSQSCT